MKKSELKELLKVIVQEVVAAKQEQLSETKGLSGMKKAPESTEHTEKVADSKDLTGPAPKEKEEGKKLPVVKKPANPQKVGKIEEGVASDAMTYALVYAVSSYIIVWALVKFHKFTGKLPWPWSKLGDLDVENKIKRKIKSEEERNEKLQGLTDYCEKRANDLSKDPILKSSLEKNDFKAIVSRVKELMTEPYNTESDKLWANKMAGMEDVQGGDPSKTINMFSRIVQNLIGKVPSESPKSETPTTGSSELKKEIIQMIREEIEEMARTAGAIGNKYKVQDPSSPTGWVVKGHKTVPDGTPTEAPKGGAPTAAAPKSTPSKPTTDKAAVARTEDAVENILKFKPNATEQEVADELAKQSVEDAPLSLDAAVISTAIAKAKEGTAGEESSAEPDIAALAAKEKAEKQRKIANLRAYLMRKKGIKPAE